MEFLAPTRADNTIIRVTRKSRDRLRVNFAVVAHVGGWPIATYCVAALRMLRRVSVPQRAFSRIVDGW